MSDEWSRIAPAVRPDADNVRRIEADHPLDFFRGRDFEGRYLLTLTTAGSMDLPEAPRLSGIAVVVERAPEGGVRLVLSLQDDQQFDIFRALCRHLLDATRHLPPGANADGLRLVLRRLRDWHDMLKGRRDDLLPLQRIIGLFGELVFLRDELLTRIPLLPAILSWRGPHGEEQDFAVGRWLIEIKTQLSSADQRLQISSEAQLDAPAGELLLCQQRIAAGEPSVGGAATLNTVVAEMRARIDGEGESARDAFEDALLASDYAVRPEYDERAWVVIGRRTFEVREGFPRLVPSLLPTGIQQVRYDILVADCLPFLVETEAAMARVAG